MGDKSEMKKELYGKEFLKILKEEVNVKKIKFVSPERWTHGDICFFLDTKITPELREEGIINDCIRKIQSMKKKLGINQDDKIGIKWTIKKL
jgi:isoleucyl-tRNA synthetase